MAAADEQIALADRDRRPQQIIALIAHRNRFQQLKFVASGYDENFTMKILKVDFIVAGRGR